VDQEDDVADAAGIIEVEPDTEMKLRIVIPDEEPFVDEPVLVEFPGDWGDGVGEDHVCRFDAAIQFKIEPFGAKSEDARFGCLCGFGEL